MKKILSAVLVCVLMLSCALALASCAKIVTGTYEHVYGSEAAGYKVTYAFSGTKVEVSRQLVSAIGSLNPTVKNGTYEIIESEDGSKTITFTWDSSENNEDGVAESGVSLSFSEGTKDGKAFIEIGGVEFVKVD